MKRALHTLFLLLLACCAVAQGKHTLSPRQIHQLDSISTQDVPKKAPGIASGIVMNGKIVYTKYSGYADLKDSVLITNESRFNIASNGKQFTALAILILVDQQKIKLQDDIRLFFPDLLPQIKEKISLENLLTHSSGIRDVYDLWALQGITWWEQTFTNQDALALLYRQRELNFTPGTKHSYSNSNYILLALLIERVSGQSFTRYTNEMFRKLKMPNTSFESDYQKIRGRVALPYFNFDTWFGYDWICNIHGDGNLFSTLEDQLTWEKTIQTKSSDFLSKKLIAQSQQIVPTTFLNNYGYGLEFGTHKGLPYMFHEGSTGAWKATFVRFPKDKISIVTLTNSGKTIPSSQTRQIADVVLALNDQPKTFPTTPAATGSFVSITDAVGIYQNEYNFTFTFEQRDTSLFLLRSGRNDIRLEREGPNIFHQWNDFDFKQEFTVSDKGGLNVTAYYTTHAPYTLTRKSANWSGFDYHSLNGDFQNDETGVCFKLKYTSGITYEVTLRGEKNAAKILSSDRLMLDNYNLDISRDEAGNVLALLLSGDRISNVRFSKKP